VKFGYCVRDLGSLKRLGPVNIEFWLEVRVEYRGSSRGDNSCGLKKLGQVQPWRGGFEHSDYLHGGSTFRTLHRVNLIDQLYTPGPTCATLLQTSLWFVDISSTLLVAPIVIWLASAPGN
jgi:hypothetical protein